MNDALLIQQASGRHTEMLHLSKECHARYAQRHRMDFWSLDSSLQDTRHPAWDKILIILEALISTKDYKLIFWLDADTLVVRPEIDLRSGLNANSNLGMVLHPRPFHLNSGVIFIRNVPVIHQYFMDAWKAWPVNHGWEEQVALMRLVLERGDLGFEVLASKWNSTNLVNPCNRPVIVGWHGIGSTDERIASIRDAVRKAHEYERDLVQSGSIAEMHDISYETPSHLSAAVLDVIAQSSGSETAHAVVSEPDWSDAPRFGRRQTILSTLRRLFELHPGASRIVETGTLRDFSEQACDAQGWSTVAWGWYSQKVSGAAITVDVDPGAIETCRAATRPYESHLNYVAGDSLEFLRNWSDNYQDKIDLLYLDSMDYFEGLEERSELHSLSEASAALPHLSDSALVLFDDTYDGGYDEEHRRRSFVGKGARAIPYLMEQGFDVEWHRDAQVLLSRSASGIWNRRIRA